jgi:hypothetical protein
MAYGLVSDALENGSPQVRSFGFFSPHLKSQITSLSLTAAYVFPPPPAKRRAAAPDGRNSDTLACHVVGTCVIKRTCTVSEDHICRVSQIKSPRYEVEKGAPFDAAARVRSRGISGNTSALRSRVSDTRHQACVYRPPLVFQVVRSQTPCLGAFSIAHHAPLEMRGHGT